MCFQRVAKAIKEKSCNALLLKVFIVPCIFSVQFVVVLKTCLTFVAEIHHFSG